jgi:hypothetical protein
MFHEYAGTLSEASESPDFGIMTIARVH